MMQPFVLASHQQIRDVMVKVLDSHRVRPDVANHVVASLIQTSLRGVDSHGIELFPHYVRALEGGRINPDPCFRTTTRGATAILNADHGFGHAAGAEAMSTAISLAKHHGVAVSVVADSTHFGAAAYFGLAAAEAGCVGLALTHADSLMLSFGGTKPFFGTNAICITAPCKGETPVCLDMASTQISWNRVRRAVDAGSTLEAGLAADARGEATRNANDAAALLPIGLYKGFGLAMMVDVVCSLLTGMPYGPQLIRMYADPIAEKRHLGHFFAALDISKFIDPEVFSARLQEMVAALRLEPATHDAAGVMVPGDPEKSTEVKRKVSGIPIPEAIFGEFMELGRGVGATLSPLEQGA